MHADDDALVVEAAVGTRRVATGRGDARAARRLLAQRADVGALAWASLPRWGGGPAAVVGAPEGARPDPAEDLPGGLGDLLEPATAWDWFALAPAAAPRAAPGVVRLDPGADGSAIRACLAQANPSTQADPDAEGEAAWFGVPGDVGLVGVIGASRRPGDPARADLSWHLHGLGVRGEARGAGLGAALTATAAAAAFDAGADWVSLGMYADNDPARRIYTGLGFVVEGRFSSYRRRAEPGA